jgi:hypothetical protein
VKFVWHLPDNISELIGARSCSFIVAKQYFLALEAGEFI